VGERFGYFPPKESEKVAHKRANKTAGSQTLQVNKEDISCFLQSFTNSWFSRAAGKYP